MKKIVFILSIILLTGSSSLFSQQKQGLKVEASLGIVIGDESVNSATVFGLGADVSYLFKVHNSFLVGPSIGYHNFFGKKSSQPAAFNTALGNDIQILPIAAATRYYLFDELFIGADLGYGLFLDDMLKDESGFLFKPKVGVDWDGISTNLSYSVIMGDSVNFSAIYLGIQFSF